MDKTFMSLLGLDAIIEESENIEDIFYSVKKGFKEADLKFNEEEKDILDSAQFYLKNTRECFDKIKTFVELKNERERNLTEKSGCTIK